MHLSSVSPPGGDFCAPKQMDGGLNIRYVQLDEGEDVCGTRREKNELLKNERFSN